MLADQLVQLVEAPPPRDRVPPLPEPLAVVAALLAQRLVPGAQAPPVKAGRVLDVAQPLHVARHHARGQIALDGALGLARAARKRLTLDSILESLCQFALVGGRVRHCASILALATVALIAPADAAARDFAVTSFDGTRIEAHFFPAKAGSKAPTILYGPGWGNPGASDTDHYTSEANGTIGISRLIASGYNVLTWDPRGFGNSGGEAKWDSPGYEARDVQALMDALAGFPEAKLDAPGDPAVGMAGASYGGGIQWATAAIDDRVDVITPVVAWHSLVSSLYKGSVFKAGWGSLLCGLGSAGGSTGLVNPAGVQAGTMDSHMYSICSSGTLTGRLSTGDRGWLDDRGPGATWMDRVRTPALVLHGTVDTLFTPQEAIDNFRVLRANGVPTRMMWFCGGHGRCQTDQGAARYFEAAVLRWLGAYLKGGDRSATGPRFEWIDQGGEWHQASDYPLADAGTITATGEGTVRFVAGDAGTSGTATAATPSASGIDISVPRADSRENLVGTPRLELDYRAQGTRSSTQVYAQIVDVERDLVIGGQVTPIPIELDHQQRTLNLSLEPVAYALSPSSRLRLELIPGRTCTATSAQPGASTSQASR